MGRRPSTEERTLFGRATPTLSGRFSALGGIPRLGIAIVP
jgi:hypothetical protein